MQPSNWVYLLDLIHTPWTPFADPLPPSRLYKSISEKNGSQSRLLYCENVWLYCILHLWKVAWQPSEQFFPVIPGTVPVFENFLESTWSPYLCLLNSLICQLPNSKSLRGVEPQRPKMPPILFIYRFLFLYTNTTTVWVCLRPLPWLRETLKGSMHTTIVLC